MARSTDLLDAAVAALPGVDEAGGLTDLDEASGRELLEAAAGSVAVRRRAEVAELVGGPRLALSDHHPVSVDVPDTGPRSV